MIDGDLNNDCLAHSRPLRRPDCDDRLRLDRQGHPAAAGAAHRVRSRQIRRHRPGRHRPGAAGRAQAALPQGRPHQGQLPRGAQAAAHRRPRARHDRQRLGRYLVGRPDGLLQGHQRLLYRHRGRAVARPLQQPQFLRLAALQLCAAREPAGVAQAPAGRDHGGELLRRQSRHGVLVRQAGAARSGARHRSQNRRAQATARNGAG